ncbi:HAD hydrolase-like protein [Rossellomorea aquimaris]|uniref:HAD hydrolase-like protein n=1 Tax=Rossellomorea aquimaris TaxID=189382 RepID=UPI001CD300CD|nr:HAD hydrolase-like protein [Rossellomorea aquimaris]MCA1058994.1 HAD hydrolase-like protein [Rossellomorea aquimaris]
MKAAMIFDMDGTIFQTNRILEASLHDTFEILREEGKWKDETPIEAYREIMGVPLSVVWETLLPDHPNDVHGNVNKVFQDKLIHNIQGGKGALYPHTEALLSYLKERGYPIFVASNGYPHYLHAIVEYYSLDRWVTSIYSIQEIESDDKGDLIKKVKEDHQLTHGVVIGDRASDFKGAAVNHFLSIGCAFDFSQEEELLEADIVIRDLLEIRDYLEEVK